MKRFLFGIFLLFASSMGTKGQSTGDSIVASLLTCSPGTKAYSLYGHTGLRVKNVTQGLDVVFNYGVFDFRRPHFTWHFILGECDYEVAGYPFAAFMEEYESRGSSVIEQTLNLTQEEANRLFAQLIINCQPENKIYRYNFLLNNCTTRARDQIEEAVTGKVVYEESEEHPTYRELLRRMTKEYPWTTVGNDLLLGARCDTMLSDRAAQFLPGQLMQYFAQARVFDAQGNRKPLVAKTEELVAARPQAVPEEFPLSPLMVGLIMVACGLLIVFFEYLIHRQLWGIDILLMLLQGLAGCLLTFMFLFSKHPTVGSNWQIWLLNPIPLFCIFWVVKCAIQKRTCAYHYLNLLAIGLFIVFMPWIPQSFSALTLPLALLLLTRPVSYLIRYGRKEETKEDEVKKLIVNS